MLQPKILPDEDDPVISEVENSEGKNSDQDIDEKPQIHSNGMNKKAKSQSVI
jgi:hypothetical protein